MSARDERHGAMQFGATGRTLQADAVGHDAMTIAKRTILTYLATDGPAECLDGSRIIHARSTVRLTTAGRTGRPPRALLARTGTARLARSA